MSACPLCAAPVQLTADVMEGEIISCADCAAELEVLSITPVSIGAAPEVEEDWGE